MQYAQIGKYIFSFFLLVLLQITIFFHTSIFGVAYCFIYVSLILFLPVFIPRSWLMTIGFVLGLVIDMFYDTPGINTFACVTVAFIKNPLFSVFMNPNDLDERDTISITSISVGVFVPFVAILLFVHHFLVLFLQNFDIQNFFYILLSSTLSTVLTLLVLVAGEYLFFSNRK
jgi:rod shape-determining protein MreD